MKSSRWMLLPLPAVLVFAMGLALALRAEDGPTAAPPLSEVSNQGNFPATLQGGFRYWSNGNLIAFNMEMVPNRAGVALYDRDGAVAREATVWLEGARSLSLTNVAVSPSGNLVVSGGTTNNEGVIANFIAEIGSDDRVRRVVRTSPFVPWNLCALDDGTVWAYGFDRDASGNMAEHALRLRQYSFDKGRLQAMFDPSALPDAQASRDIWGLIQGGYPGVVNLRCNSKIVVLYNARTGDLLEYDLQKKQMVINKVTALPADLTFHITGFALTDSGEMFASFHDASNRKAAVSGLFHLEHDNGGSGYKWVAVPGTVGVYLKDSPIHRLWGADGDKLVFSRTLDGRLYWTK